MSVGDGVVGGSVCLDVCDRVRVKGGPSPMSLDLNSEPSCVPTCHEGCAGGGGLGGGGCWGGVGGGGCDWCSV